MPGTVVDKAICENCGADVRENTLFCYNCGSRVADNEPVVENVVDTEIEKPDVDPETAAALEDLSERIKIEPPSEEEVKRAKAAAERKKARINPRKPREVIWEPAEDSPNRILLLTSVLIAVIAAAVVFVTLIWK
jgi:rRNA maturation endonuclease Nob1